MTDRKGPSLIGREGRVRVVIEHVSPEIDGGLFPVKRTPQQPVVVEVDLFADGHDVVAGDLLYRRRGQRAWQRVPFAPLGNDRYTARFDVPELGDYEYTVEAWVDTFAGWARDLEKRRAAGQDLGLALETGAALVEAAAARGGDHADRLARWCKELRRDARRSTCGTGAAHPELAQAMRNLPPSETVRRYPRVLGVLVERERARFSNWYEFFPRSCGDPGVHGTFDDALERLEYAASLGFHVIYLPPIHPVGRNQRKGPNNDPQGRPDDPGSPWAIGAAEGGHKSVHPELGGIEAFSRFVARARELGLEIALDLAFQCAPDHPYVRQHPEWFRHRPDGTIQYAENPPKRYQDIYPFDFECEDYQALWKELLSVVEFWVRQGVTVFRVDNPHTKPFRFWEWLIARVRKRHPEVIFLSEAFTRPRVMHHLAKLGFSQSYTYFTWRTGKQELIEYFTELACSEGREYFRPNVWPNTPDILHAYLQEGGRPAFMIRLLLATMLSANYGIYGPAYELNENRPVRTGTEEYLDSEKYQLRHWDVEREDSLKDLVAVLNRIRNGQRALQSDWSLEFHDVDNDSLLAFSKRADDGALLVVVNLDATYRQSGWLQVPLERFGLNDDAAYVAHDLLTDARYPWQGVSNFVALDPHTQPGHVFRLIDEGDSDEQFPSYLA